MKKMKKVLAIALSLSLVLSLAFTSSVFADTTYTITIKEAASGHTYEVYQIFTGDISTDANSNKVLANIEWGADAEAVTSGQTAAAVADLLAAKTGFTADDLFDYVTLKTGTGHPVKTAGASDYNATTKKYTISGLEPGYYLVKDVVGETAISDGDVYSEYIIKVVSNVETAPKGDAPTVTKKVLDSSTWQDSTDGAIGDTVDFKLTATMPSNIGEYTNGYKVVFTDTLSSGLTYTADSVEVKIGTTDVTDSFTVAGPTNGVLTITCNNIKGISGVTVSADTTVVVTYKATINENAITGNGTATGVNGNENKVKLTYNNDPKWDGTGTAPTGTTPEDKVSVFTYKVIVNKTDGTDALAGAKFKLEKEDAEATGGWALVEEYTAGTETTFEFTGLDEGFYKLTETQEPVGYNKLEDPIYFEVEATTEAESATPALTALSATQCDENGTAVSPAEVTFTASLSAGSLTTEVVNQSGTVLPETGGMGTTIFYVLGAILVAAAAVLLISRRRADS